MSDEERDKLVEYMRTYERFGGLRVNSYCIRKSKGPSFRKPEEQFNRGVELNQE